MVAVPEQVVTPDQLPDAVLVAGVRAAGDLFVEGGAEVVGREAVRAVAMNDGCWSGDYTARYVHTQ